MTRGAFLGRLRQIPWREIAKDAFDRVLLVAKAAAGIHIVNAHVCGVAIVWGPSMVPTLNITGDVVAVERMTPWWRNLEIGDVVLFRSPSNPNRIVTKRVLGLEGDSVTYRLDPAGRSAIDAATATVQVPKGHAWVQGDNIYDSKDSRQFGSIPIGLVQGRAFVRVWPPDAVGFIGKKVMLN